MWRNDGHLGRMDRSIFGGPIASTVFGTEALARVGAENHRLIGLPTMTSGQLTAADLAPFLTTGGFWTEYALDAADNWMTIARPGSVRQPKAGADNRYTTFDSTVVGDASGSTTESGDGASYRYNGFGQMVSAESAAGNWSFTYDALGRLAWFLEPDGSGALQYAEGAILRELGGQQDSLYVPGVAGLPVALVSGVGDTQFLHYGWADRIEAVTSDNGAIDELYEYSAYGQPNVLDASGSTRAASAIVNRLLIAGQPYFGELGIHQFGQRWYRPLWGRFLTPDPAGLPDGPNAYTFAGAQPLIYGDPHGLAKQGVLRDWSRASEGPSGWPVAGAESELEGVAAVGTWNHLVRSVIGTVAWAVAPQLYGSPENLEKLENIIDPYVYKMVSPEARERAQLWEIYVVDNRIDLWPGKFNRYRHQCSQKSWSRGYSS